MPEQVPDGSIVITPKEFYDGVRNDIAEIKLAVSPLPDLKTRVDKLEVEVDKLVSKQAWLSGLAAGLGATVGTIASRLMS
ncbi:MAG: hypothetical protein ACXVGN_00100 [Mycobacteriaceae bacterium]